MIEPDGILAKNISSLFPFWSISLTLIDVADA